MIFSKTLLQLLTFYFCKRMGYHHFILLYIMTDWGYFFPPLSIQIRLINFASKIGATVTKFWTPDVTHVVAATDSNGACARTLKVLMGILNGLWILRMDCKL